MKDVKSNYSFLVVGSTAESTETSEGFTRYVGLGSSFVKAFNPDKKTLDEIMGYESANEPEYIKDTDNGKEAHLIFIVETDPETNNGIDIKNRLTFILRNEPDYSSDKTKVRVIDSYGNTARVPVEDAKAGKALPDNLKIDHNNYRMAAVGEADLVGFLKAFLNIPKSLDYVNGTWALSKNADKGKFALESIPDYFKGDFSEIKKALAYQPNNKVKLLYGVRTTDEGKQYQAICSREGFILRNNANTTAISKLEKDLANAKANGSYANVDYQVCELKEWAVEPTNLNAPSAPDNSSNDAMPWD